MSTKKSVDYRQKLSDLAIHIHDVFGLQEQGRELIALVTETLDCKYACLLFLDFDGEDFTIPFCYPESEDNTLCGLRINGQNPVIEYLRREQKPVTRENLATLPELRHLRGTGGTKVSEIELLVPLISRDRLMGILMLGEKQSGRYSPSDFTLLEDVADRVAVSMEKEYLREQLNKRQEELSVINHVGAIMTSSLDIQGVFGSFVQELKKAIDISWAAIVLSDDNDLYVLALSHEIGSGWKVGERLPIKDTPAEWVVTHKKAIVESDLSKKSRFPKTKYHLKRGMRSAVLLPLIARGRAIGSLIVASRRPNAYNDQHLMLLKQVASQIAMPIENSRLFAEVQEKARIDKLTGLLNRRSLDEVMVTEINRHSRYGGVFSIIILDLDYFKTFNDRYGHLAGDGLLGKIGSILKNTIRSADQAFRYGGDEFAIFLPNTPIGAASLVAERVRKVIAGSIPVTASLGLASWPANGREANEVIAAADAALYDAKRSGRDRIARATSA